MEWQPIETAPKDGERVWVKRVYKGQLISEGWARWGINSADAPMRQWVALDIPPDNEYADVERWLTDDRRYSFPMPTHWMPRRTAPAQNPAQGVSDDMRQP